MKSAFWRSIAVVALVAVPMMANANDATIGSEVAHNAMAGSTLMNTTAIFNAFPHMVVENGTGVELNNFDDGQGRVWWEAYDNLWLNMNVGRMDYGLSGTDFMWGAGSPGTPFGAVFEDNTWLNLGIARPLSGGGAWAVGAILAPFGGTELKGGLPELENNETGYGFNASWGNGNGMHLAGELAFSTEEQIDNTAATNENSRDNRIFDLTRTSSLVKT